MGFTALKWDPFRTLARVHRQGQEKAAIEGVRSCARTVGRTSTADEATTAGAGQRRRIANAIASTSRFWFEERLARNLDALAEIRGR